MIGFGWQLITKSDYFDDSIFAKNRYLYELLGHLYN
jgi:hypothetical protein